MSEGVRFVQGDGGIIGSAFKIVLMLKVTFSSFDTSETKTGIYAEKSSVRICLTVGAYLLCVCYYCLRPLLLTSAPQREGALCLLRQLCKRGKTRRLYGVSSHCDVVPSTPDAIVPRLPFRLHLLNS